MPQKNTRGSKTARIVAVIKELNEGFKTEILYDQLYCTGKPHPNSRLYQWGQF